MKDLKKGYSIVRKLKEKRERLGLLPLKTTKLFSSKTKNSDDIPSINILDQISIYSENELRIILSQLTGLQLTDGCNGRCPFCFLGTKKGVTSKYSFESIKIFLNKYSKYIPGSTALYWDSDPFDYVDRSYTFTDVYTVWDALKPNDRKYVSTAIPAGDETNFIDFIDHQFIAFLNKNEPLPLKIRLSLSKFNIQRIELVFQEVTGSLEKIYTKPLISKFLRKHIVLANTFDDEVVTIGGLIEQHDDIKDIFTPACKDGTVISPKSIKAVMVTIPTKYEPSGQKQIELIPKKVESLVPHYHHIIDDSGFFTQDSLEKKLIAGQVMLDIIRKHDGNIFNLKDKIDNVILKMAREIASVGRLIIDLAFLYSHPKTIQKPEELKKQYLKIVAHAYLQRRKNIMKLIEASEVLLDTVDGSKKAELQYYKFLTSIYLKKLDYLVELIKSTISINRLSTTADLLSQIEGEYADKIDVIINGLRKHNPNTINKVFSLKSNSEGQPDWYETAEYLCEKTFL